MITEQKFLENVFAFMIKGLREMKKILGAILTIVWMIYFSPLHLDNAYLRSHTFERVTVERQDTVWNIAGRYTRDEGNIQKLVEAIIEVNGLTPDAAIRAGQSLQVPVLEKATTQQLAER